MSNRYRKEYDNYFKTQMAVHSVGHDVLKFVKKRFDEFLEHIGSLSQDERTEEYRRIARNPGYIDSVRDEPTSGEDIAKLFVSKSRFDGNLDPHKVFKIIKNCKLFNDSQDMDLCIEQMIEDRNDFAHTSAEQKVPHLTDNEAISYFTHMKDLLSKLKVIGMSDCDHLSYILSEVQRMDTFTEALTFMMNSSRMYVVNYFQAPMPQLDRLKLNELLNNAIVTREPSKGFTVMEGVDEGKQKDLTQQLLERFGHIFGVQAPQNCDISQSVGNNISNSTTNIHINYINYNIGESSITKESVNSFPVKRLKSGSSNSENDFSSGDHRKRRSLTAPESENSVPVKRLKSGSSNRDQDALDRASSSSQTSPELTAITKQQAIDDKQQAINDVRSTSSVDTGSSSPSSKPSIDGDNSVSEEVRRMPEKVLKELDERGVDYKLVIEKKVLQDLLIKAKTEKQTGADARGILQPKQEQPTASGTSKGNSKSKASTSKGSGKSKAPKQDWLSITQLLRKRKVPIKQDRKNHTWQKFRGKLIELVPEDDAKFCRESDLGYSNNNKTFFSLFEDMDDCQKQIGARAFISPNAMDRVFFELKGKLGYIFEISNYYFFLKEKNNENDYQKASMKYKVEFDACVNIRCIGLPGQTD